MKRLVATAFSLSAVLLLLSCQPQEDSALVTKRDPRSQARSEAGLSWRFSTPNEFDDSEHNNPGNDSRQFYFKRSQNFTRLVTFTVSNRSLDPITPTFKIYKAALCGGGCVTYSSISAPGNYSFSQGDCVNYSSYQADIYTWSPGTLSRYGSATFSMYLHMNSPTSCVEGIMAADLISPSYYPSSRTYSGGDEFAYVALLD